MVGGTLTGHLILWDLAEGGLSEDTETDDFVVCIILLPKKFFKHIL